MSTCQKKKGVDKMSITDVLNVAENFEIEGYKFYNIRKDEIKDSIAKEIFNFLANMEKEHAEYIKK